MYRVELHGPNVFLCDVTCADVSERYCEWLNDPEVNRFLETRHIPQTLDSIRSFVEKVAGKSDEILLAIRLKETLEHIGNIKLGPINPIHKCGDISLLIGEKCQWGKGFAAEAIRLIVGYGFKHLGLQKIEAGCYDENRGSEKAFIKAGFRVEGELREHFMSGTERVSRICLGITRSEWELGRER